MSEELITTSLRKRPEEEIRKATEQTGQLRLYGATYEQIAEQLKVSSRQARRYYQKYIERHKDEWLKDMPAILTELNMAFRRAMSFAERKKRLAEEKEDLQAMGSWNKQVVEIARNHWEYLQALGLLKIEEFQKETEKSPIKLMVEEYRKILLEGPNEPSASAENIAAGP